MKSQYETPKADFDAFDGCSTVYGPERSENDQVATFRPLPTWAETTMLIGEISADRVVHNHEKDSIAGLETAEEIMQSAVKIYKEIGSDEQIVDARDRSDRLKWLIEEG